MDEKNLEHVAAKSSYGESRDKEEMKKIYFPTLLRLDVTKDVDSIFSLGLLTRNSFLDLGWSYSTMQIHNDTWKLSQFNIQRYLVRFDFKIRVLNINTQSINQASTSIHFLRSFG
ncbi:hypothetical protein HS088_TW23G00344 [Tripterygium wilfordii]|uniref:Uncharacterized protein n=1 Tax=Tripterygium wilfordii TaxID=458696 RepID=A0A7J7BUR3_TRIWF|nr:hypothetical protein HS088_TW23G00344 [Tripterygium wilfordii]